MTRHTPKSQPVILGVFIGYKSWRKQVSQVSKIDDTKPSLKVEEYNVKILIVKI